MLWTDLVCLMNHAIFSVVHSLAAINKSPSFSLFSSSMTTTKSPRLNAARAASMVENGEPDEVAADEEEEAIGGLV